MKKTKENDPIIPVDEASTPARFHGDPAHAGYLLGTDRVDGIRYAAEHGFHRFADADGSGLYSSKEWDALGEGERAGVLSMVASIAHDPHARPYASMMPRNRWRDEYRALDDALRDTMGYARFGHGE